MVSSKKKIIIYFVYLLYILQISKEIDRESSQKHFETLDSLWGRPGNGAPRAIKNKLNLNDLLYKIPFKAEFVL